MDNWELYYRTHKDKGSNAITGVPPLTFVSNGENLVDYRIYGASGGVGDLITDENDRNFGRYAIPVMVRGKNLFDIATITPNSAIQSATGTVNYSAVSDLSDYISVDGLIEISLSYDYENLLTSAVRAFSFFTYSKERLSYVTYSPALKNITVNIPSNTKYVRFNYDKNCTNIMLTESLASSNYEPYYEPISTNTYLDEPLGEGESISMSDTGVSIPTINGTNILTVDTAVQPSKMYIKYGGSNNVNQSLMKYLEYKYKFAKE